MLGCPARPDPLSSLGPGRGQILFERRRCCDQLCEKVRPPQHPGLIRELNAPLRWCDKRAIVHETRLAPVCSPRAPSGDAWARNQLSGGLLRGPSAWQADPGGCGGLPHTFHTTSCTHWAAPAVWLHGLKRSAQTIGHNIQVVPEPGPLREPPRNGFWGASALNVDRMADRAVW